MKKKKKTISYLSTILVFYVTKTVFLYILVPIVIYFWNLHTILIHILKFQLEETTLKNKKLELVYLNV